MASQPPRDAIPKLARQPGSAATVTYRIPDPDEPGGRLPVAGTLNFRELGGYRTRDGQSIRRGRVYRSDHLNDVTSDGIAAVASYGLRTVVDLRFGDERAAQPSRLPKGVEIIEARPDAMEVANQAGMIERILAGEITGYTADDFADDYRSMVHDGADLFVVGVGVIVRRMTRPDTATKADRAIDDMRAELP